MLRNFEPNVLLPFFGFTIVLPICNDQTVSTLTVYFQFDRMMVEQGKEVRLALSKSQNQIISQQFYFK